MATIAVHRENGTKKPAAVTPVREWNPFRMLHDVLRRDPFSEMVPTWLGEETAGFTPAFEVKETAAGFVFKADLPGVKEADLDVKLVQNRLSVTGKREEEKTEKTDTYYTYERSYGTFTRSFTLPEGIDAEKIKAELKEGVLTIEIPKKPEVMPKKISVKAG